MKYLVEELHADVNARDFNGYTPLHHAAARGDNELIKYLMSKGADITAVSREGSDRRRHGERAGAANPAVPRDASRCSRSSGRRTATSASPVERQHGRSP